MSALPPGDIDAMRGRPLRRELIAKPLAPLPDTTTRRLATCRCGLARAICTGAPLRVSVCHCPDCQRRSGSAFAVTARFATDRVTLDGPLNRWSSTGGSGVTSVYQFCSTCGSTLAYTSDARPNEVSIPVGAFADNSFPPPTVSTWEATGQPWVTITGNPVEHND